MFPIRLVAEGFVEVKFMFLDLWGSVDLETKLKHLIELTGISRSGEMLRRP
jgi:hypothetical protein